MVNGKQDRSAIYRGHGWWRDRTILDDFAENVRRRPDHPAVIARSSPDGATRTIGYAELSTLADRCAGAFRSLGVRPGDTVSVQLQNWWQLAPLALGCLRAGARICPLLPDYRRRELAVMLPLTGARVLITMSEYGGDDLAALGASMAAEVPTLEHVLVCGDRRPAGTLDLDDYVFGSAWEHSHPVTGPGLAPDDPYLVLFTSGTTGEPKGVLHSQNTLYAAMHAETVVFGLDDSLVLTTTSANTHYTGFVQGMLLPFVLGGTSLYQNSHDGDETLDLIAAHRATFLYASPAFLRMVLDAQAVRPRDVGSLRVVVSGSAPILPQFVAEVGKQLGVRLHSLYGMSENGPVTISRREDPEDWAAHSDGHPTPGTEIRIDPLPEHADGSGRLWVRGPTQCLGYEKRAELYASQLDADGWFDTGDLARPDGRGGLRITGRIKDVILHNAFIVPVTDLEALIAEHPKVHAATVVGVPERGDETICAVVVCRGEPVTLDELRAHLRDAGMNELYWPERLELRDELPRTALGKVQKAVLRDQLA